MNRRGFLLGLAAALILPEPPRVRAYSFLPGSAPMFRFALFDEVTEQCNRTIAKIAKITTLNGKVYGWADIEIKIGEVPVLLDIVSIEYSGPARELGGFIDRVMVSR